MLALRLTEDLFESVSQKAEPAAKMLVVLNWLRRADPSHQVVYDYLVSLQTVTDFYRAFVDEIQHYLRRSKQEGKTVQVLGCRVDFRLLPTSCRQPAGDGCGDERQFYAEASQLLAGIREAVIRHNAFVEERRRFGNPGFHGADKRGVWFKTYAIPFPTVPSNENLGLWARQRWNDAVEIIQGDCETVTHDLDVVVGVLIGLAARFAPALFSQNLRRLSVCN